MKPIIGFDCDGVIGDMNSYALRLINEELGTKFCEADWNDWKVSACLGDAAEEVFKRHLGAAEIWTAISVFPEVTETLHRLSERFELYMVSAVWHKFAALRRQWVTKHGLPFSRVIANADKASVAVDLGMVGFVEDRQDKARSVRDAGIQAYLIARPYNVEEEGIFRGSWREVIRHIEQGGLIETSRR